MIATDVPDAFDILSAFLTEDEHYLASSKVYGDRRTKGVADALELFLTRPELGFVWLACDDHGIAGICVVCYAISTSLGTLVGKLDDVSVKENRRGQGIGTALIQGLKKELHANKVMRIDVALQ